MQSSKWAPKPASSPKSKATPAPTPAAPAAAATVSTQPAPEIAPEVQISAAQPEIQSSSTNYDYGYPDPSADSFAQTAGTDDLFFDDDFTPVAEPLVEQTPVETHTEEPVEVPAFAEALPPQHAPRGPSNGNGDRGGRGGRAGRGRGGRGRGRGGLVPSAPRENDHKSNTTDIRKEVPEGEDTVEKTDSTPEPPTGPKDAAKATTSVRGDRTLTGGPQRTRLTEEQLNAKLANMRSKNETLAAAHARAEQDAAQFEAREALAAKQSVERKKQAAERQKQDRQNRQQMMGERERNRQRKMDSLKGREWDNEKEDGFTGTGEERRRGAARGAYGGVAPSPRPVSNAEEPYSTHADHDAEPFSHTPRGNNRGGHRGGRGNRGGDRGDRGGRGGGGRGGTSNHRSDKENQPQQPPKASDFPELPQSSAAKDISASQAPKKLEFPIRTKTSELQAAAAATASEAEPERPGIKKQESFGLGSPLAPGKSWADQVEGV